MKNLTREHSRILSFIDSIMSLSENESNDDGFNFNLSVNPFDFLLSIILKKASYDEIVEWLSNFLVVGLVPLEMSIKALLIAKLKERVDCNSDPRIPNYLRKDINRVTTNQLLKGINIDIKSIDYTDMLSVSPLSPYGSTLYFGTKSYFIINDERFINLKYATYADAVEDCKKYGVKIENIIDKSEVNNVYELARANDFNAFIWFVINKSHFNVNQITDNENSILGEININKEINGDSDDKNVIFPGNVYHKQGSSIYSLCISEKHQKKIEYKIDDEDAISNNVNPEIIDYHYSPRNYTYKIVPMSSDSESVNWYYGNNTNLNFLKKKKDKVVRNYDNEYAICNLRFIDKGMYKLYDDDVERYYYNCINFTILPKPLVHIPRDEEPAWRFKRILFDKNGTPNKKGKYSVKVNGNARDDGEYYTYDSDKNGVSLKVKKEDGSYFLTNTSKDTLESVFYECYPGLTVYEFNYDYVMSMQLFDPSVVASRLISSITSIIYGGVNVNLSKTESRYQMRISEIVKNIVESTEYEVSDCFYTFTNDKYNEMMLDSELKRSKLYPFNNNGKDDAEKTLSDDEIYKILNEFNGDSNINENVDVIKRTFNKVTASVTDEVLPEDKYKVKVGLITDIIRSLSSILVECIITPKLIMLFEINKALLGERTKYRYTIEDFLNSINDIIVSIVMEIRDLVLQSILDWAMKILNEILSLARDMIFREQLEYYSRLMRLLLKACAFKTKHRKALDSKLDNVDYADIDEVDRPQETNC